MKKLTFWATWNWNGSAEDQLGEVSSTVPSDLGADYLGEAMVAYLLALHSTYYELRLAEMTIHTKIEEVA